VVKYHGLARRHLTAPRFLMRPLLNGGTLGGRSSVSVPSFPDQVRLLETFLGRRLPGRVRELFRPGSPTARRLLPLATGHELDPPMPHASPEDAFTAAQAQFKSVLGRAIGNAQVQRFAPDDVWPPGLLVVEDCGCAIYRAIDLDDLQLRVIEHEHFEPVDDPQAAAGPDAQLAYSEPAVPRQLQHQFIVCAPTLDDWLESQNALQ
jgi:hypothetical protein